MKKGWVSPQSTNILSYLDQLSSVYTVGPNDGQYLGQVDSSGQFEALLKALDSDNVSVFPCRVNLEIETLKFKLKK